jgi:hypothetical protein
MHLREDPMNPKHDEWLAIERGADLRREAASSHLLARAGDASTERRRGASMSGSAKALFEAALLALKVVRPTPSLKPPTTPTP